MAFFGLAAILFTLTLVAYLRARDTRVALAAGGFGAFAVEGGLLVAAIFIEALEGELGTVTLVGINLVALVLFYLSVVR